MGRLAPAVLAVALGGCLVSIGDVDPTSGPNPDGGAGASGGSGGSGGTTSSGGSGGSGGWSGSAGSAGTGATIHDDGSADAPPAPIFTDQFDADSASWKTIGTGIWTFEGGELRQNDNKAGLAVIYTPLVNQENYRIVVRMRQVGTGNSISGAVEIALRIDPTKPSLYHCNWEPNDGRIVLQWLDGIEQDVFIEKFVTLPTNYDPYGWFTLEMTIIAAQISCRVLELPGSEMAAAANPLFTSGHVGLKTWMMAGAFDSFEVFEP